MTGFCRRSLRYYRLAAEPPLEVRDDKCTCVGKWEGLGGVEAMAATWARVRVGRREGLDNRCAANLLCYFMRDTLRGYRAQTLSTRQPCLLWNGG